MDQETYNKCLLEFLQNRDTRRVDNSKSNNNINNTDKSKPFPKNNNEYETKGRKTTYNPSMIHLQSPKKQKQNRNKRYTIFGSSAKRELEEYEKEIKNTKNSIDFNTEFITNITFGEPSGHSGKIFEDIINENTSFNNDKYRMLIKKIAKNLKKRVKLPKCKIFKFYDSYRKLILRIANGIKKTAKQLNFWEKWENNITEKDIFEIQEIAQTSCKIIQKQNNNKSKKEIKNNFTSSKKKPKISLSLSKFTKNTEKEELNKNEEKNGIIDKNIDFLKNLDTSINNNNNYINQFSDFLKNNNIEISPETKMPLFNNNNTKYLLTSIDFWIKYIIFISRKCKDSLSIYNFINFIEQFYLWAGKNGHYNYDNFNNEIINQINILFDKCTIDKFLLIYKINNLNDLFKRYKNIYIDNSREIKIDNECQCETCKNSFYKKIVDYNKRNNCISLSQENNLSCNTYNKTKSEQKSNIFYHDKKLLNYFNFQNKEEAKNDKNIEQSKNDDIEDTDKEEINWAKRKIKNERKKSKSKSKTKSKSKKKIKKK